MNVFSEVRPTHLERQNESGGGGGKKSKGGKKKSVAKSRGRKGRK